jgi:hypothetical protein
VKDSEIIEKVIGYNNEVENKDKEGAVIYYKDFELYCDVGGKTLNRKEIIDMICRRKIKNLKEFVDFLKELSTEDIFFDFEDEEFVEVFSYSNKRYTIDEMEERYFVTFINKE